MPGTTHAKMRSLVKKLALHENDDMRSGHDDMRSGHDDNVDVDDDATEKYIIKAIENPNNDVITQYTAADLEKIKTQRLEDVPMPKSTRTTILQRLRGYRYVDELSELREGVWTRWVPLDREDSRGKGTNLTVGGILCEVRISDHGATLVCKNGKGASSSSIWRRRSSSKN